MSLPRPWLEQALGPAGDVPILPRDTEMLPCELLARSGGVPRFLYGDTAAVGISSLMEAESLDRVSPDDFAPGSWFSLAFDCDSPGKGWEDYGRLRIWRPILELHAGRLLDATGLGKTTQELLELLEQGFVRPDGANAGRPALPPVRDPVCTHARWISLVEQARADLARPGGPLKVVLARDEWLDHGSPPAVIQLLADWHRQDAAGHPWLLDWGAGSCWWGLSPELLIARDGDTLSSLALAGTRRRGLGPAEDGALEQELLASAKDREEQAVVVDWIRARLGSLGIQNIRVTEPRVRKLASLQHLASSITAPASPGCGIQQLLGALHPSPALCGAPRGLALDWLRGAEELARGLYGGVIGRVTQNGFSAHVMIRGALSYPQASRLFAGAGLLPSSDPEAEWLETCGKLDALRTAISGRPM